MRDLFEIIVTKLMIRLLRAGYGGNCGENIEGCASCEAKKAIDFLEGHISLLRL